MKKLSLLLVVLLLVVPVLAKPVRITFRRGATKAVVTSAMTGYKSKREFVVRLRAGQTFRAFADRSVYLSVIDPSGEDVSDYAANCNSDHTVSPTVAGDYKIIAVECQKADPWKGSFKLTVTAR